LKLIDALAGQECRVLVTSGSGQETISEIAHEKLFSAWPKLKDWIEKSGEALRDIDHAEEEARRWKKGGDNPQELWLDSRAKKLLTALKQFGKHPSPELQRFLRPQEVLIARLNEHAVSHQERLLIGQKLAEFSDPRPGVGVNDGVPDIVWIEIHGGQVKLEGVDYIFDLKRFYMAKFPVTNAQFEAFLNAQDGYDNGEWWKDIEQSHGREQSKWQEANCPRETVSWYDAVAFCRWLSAKTGTNIRLPTEWEWQQAAMGGDQTRDYPWTGEWDAERCNSKENQIGRTTAVGMYPNGATSQKVLDMAGNLWEWCLNKYENPSASESLNIDASYMQRVIRGGSYYNGSQYLMVSTRDRYSPDYLDSSFGFRLARDIP
jgi:hypothetical protein